MTAVSSEPFLLGAGAHRAPVGTIDAGVLAHVDAAGAVEPVDASWTLDWWVGAEDRWHHSSVEVAVRQRTVGDAPVVETALRVPGGDVVARVGGVVATAGSAVVPAVLVEFENRSAVPVALALVVRPLRSTGTGRVVSLRVVGSSVEVDGRLALCLDRPVARAVVGRSVADPAGGTVATRLAAAIDDHPPVATEDRDGRAEVAAVVPLAHSATVRALVGGRVPIDPCSAGWQAPSLSEVASGWGHHLSSVASVDLGGPTWSSACRAASATLLLTGADTIAGCLVRRRRQGGPSDATRAGAVCAAAYRLGAHDLLAPVVRALALQQRLGGACRLGDGSDGSVALLWAAAGVLGGSSAETHAEDAIAPVAVALRRLRRRGIAATGADAATAAAALRAVAPGLLAVGQPEVAADAVTLAKQVAADAVTLARQVAADAVTLAGQVAADAVTLAGTLSAQVAADADAPEPAASVGSVPDDLSDATSAAVFLADALREAAGDGPAGVSILTTVAPAWLGVPADVREVRTAWGAVSWSLRWHGERPAILWEVEPASGLGPDPAPEITAPGLDPAWRGRGWSGEALLAGPDGMPGGSGPQDDAAASGSFS